MDGCQNTLFILGIDKAMQVDISFLDIPAFLNVTSIEGMDSPRLGRISVSSICLILDSSAECQ